MLYSRGLQTAALREPLSGPWQASGPLCASSPSDLAGMDKTLHAMHSLCVKGVLTGREAVHQLPSPQNAYRRLQIITP